MEGGLSSLTLGDFAKRQIITININDPIPTVLETLFANKISSVPVIDGEQALIGVVGIVDIILFALNICETSQELVKYFKAPGTPEFVDFHEIKNYLVDSDIQKAFGIDSALFLTNYSRKDLLSVLPPGTSVGEVANGLVENHRVAIGDAKLEQFITQSDLVRVIHEKKLFGGLENKTVKELSLGTASVITIKNTERVVEAFKKIVIKKITGVGVVDENNKIVGQVSSSDIKCISTTGEMIQQLYLTYPEYRKNLEETYKVPLKTITVSESDTFQTVIATLVSNKLHRVFVAGEDNSLISVISLTDIIKKLVTK
eukprot:TRINITY_DN3611_c0_g1_i1.p1 TRINITY_DN3611_c0_g1~~TRINITY_DN3611_c0_g1_i1.p1  ORF type:complete len:314 (+),score=70.27 TRINITY_DN3611_c0_g1_i1:115-1056(+)